MAEGHINRGKIKDWSPRKQGEYVRRFYKEVNQEAAYKRSFHSADDKMRREKVTEKVMGKIHKEGLVSHIKPFMKDGLKLKGM